MIVSPDTSTALPVRNGHTGYLAWDSAGVTYTVWCKTCPGRRSGEHRHVEQWQTTPGVSSSRPDMAWKRHCKTPPPAALPTLAELRARGAR